MTDTVQPAAPTPAWTDGFSDELRTFVETKGAKSPADLATAFAAADRSAAQLIPPPVDGAWSDDARARLGIPAKVEDYKLTRPKLPDGVPYDEALERAALPIAHKLGLMPHQVQALVDVVTTHRVAEIEGATQAMTARMKESEKALRGEWGAAFDKQLSLASRTLKRFGGEDLISALNESGFGNNPHLVRAFAQIGAALAEDTLKTDGSPSAPAGDVALAEIARIQGEAMRDPKHPWINADHPEHAAVIERMRALFATAHPPPRDSER